MSVRQLCIVLLVGLLLSNVSSVVCADTPPIPGMPHAFWGTVKYTSGEDVEDGAVVQAVVDGENYTTSVVEGMYGYFNPFHVEDPDNDNQGLLITFYVNNVSTGQSVSFESGTTRLNLTVEETSGDDDDDTGGSGGSSGGGMPPPAQVSPVAVITADSVGFVNVSMTFDASSSTDGDGEIESYAWNFGDESMGSGVSVSHVYNATGTFVVSLLVTDDDGLTDVDECSVVIMVDSDEDEWGDEEESEYGTDPENASDYPLDTDGDRVPDEFDSDDDNDGLIDTAELEYGSDPLDADDVLVIQGGEVDGFLVNVDSDEEFDVFVDVGLLSSVNVSVDEQGWYELDLEGDGVVDYLYNVESGELTVVQQSLDWMTIVVVILVVVLAGVVVVWRRSSVSNKRSEEEKKWKKE